jgi:hypothetical protein
MKKLTTRAVVVLLLVTTSVGSYVFLNTVAPDSSTSTSDEKTEVETNELKALENVEATLPDAMLLKKVIEVGKRILPAS